MTNRAHISFSRFGLGVILLVVSVTSTVVLTPAARAQAADDTPMLLGLATGDFRNDLPAFDQEAGRSADFLQLFWPLSADWPTTWAPPMLEDIHQLGATPYIEITTPDFEGFDAGGYQDRLEGLVQNVRDWMDNGEGRNVVVAPFPEANLGQFSWGNNPEGYKRGFVRVRNAFLAAGIGPDRARFVFAMNGPGSDLYDYDGYYPGDDVVDIIGFSKLNRADPWHDYRITFGIHIDEMKELIGTRKPILITQTASVEEGGDRSTWLLDMFDGLAADDQVIGAVYFNVLKTEGNVQRDYRVLRDGTLDPSFRTGLDSWPAGRGADWIFDGGLDAWVMARGGEAAGDAAFADVGASPFADDIAWLAAKGITSGCNPPANTLFCPSDAVTRGQMAAFLVRALNLEERGADFADDDASVFEADIEKLAAAGITAGCNPPANDRFCPNDPVTRGQMAAFLHRALG